MTEWLKCTYNWIENWDIHLVGFPKRDVPIITRIQSWKTLPSLRMFCLESMIKYWTLAPALPQREDTMKPSSNSSNTQWQLNIYAAINPSILEIRIHWRGPRHIKPSHLLRYSTRFARRDAIAYAVLSTRTGTFCRSVNRLMTAGSYNSTVWQSFCV